MPKPYPKEFREGALALVREGRPAAQVTRELGIADSCIRNWIKQDQLERDDGLTSAEREELRELRKRVRRLEQEKDILRKAAAFFAGRRPGERFQAHRRGEGESSGLGALRAARRLALRGSMPGSDGCRLTGSSLTCGCSSRSRRSTRRIVVSTVRPGPCRVAARSWDPRVAQARRAAHGAGRDLRARPQAPRGAPRSASRASGRR